MAGHHTASSPLTPSAPGTPLRLGRLSVVGVPIGHPDDLTIRAISVLRSADVIASEDPQATQRLLAHHRIDSPLTSYGHHNRDEKTAVLIDRIRGGTHVAFVTDAGTPAVFDPGAYLVRAALQQGLPVIAVPGPSALTAALSCAGVDGDRVTFVGRLPAAHTARRTLLRQLRARRETLVIFDVGAQLSRTLRELFDVMGDRDLTIASNLTRSDERLSRTTLKTALDITGLHRTNALVTLVVGAHARSSGKEQAGGRRGRRRGITRRRRAGGSQPGNAGRRSAPA